MFEKILSIRLGFLILKELFEPNRGLINPHDYSLRLQVSLTADPPHGVWLVFFDICFKRALVLRLCFITAWIRKSTKKYEKVRRSLKKKQEL